MSVDEYIYSQPEEIHEILFSVRNIMATTHMKFSKSQDTLRQMLQRVRAEKKKAASRGGKTAKAGSGGNMKNTTFSASSGFNMPNMAGRMS